MTITTNPRMQDIYQLNLAQGKVFIVGAGIGGAEFLTIRARDLISTAEIIISDALVDRNLLDLASPQCNCIIAGKRGGYESINQAEINQMLVEYCLQGKQVVRLKSGDPWIFSRSLPEISALQAANCEWEVIAGISSAIAAPMLAGIPLTEVEASSCFAVMTGHDLDRLPWDAIAQIPTLVILMGTKNLAGLLAKLQQRKSGNEKIAIVRSAMGISGRKGITGAARAEPPASLPGNVTGAAARGPYPTVMPRRRSRTMAIAGPSPTPTGTGGLRRGPSRS